MDPTTLSALIGGGASLGGSVMSMLGNQNYQSGMLQQAQANYQLQKQAQEFQEKLATGSRTDALGNEVYWDGTGWQTKTTPGTLGVLLASQANEREKQTAGGIRSELGQEANFTNRGNAGALAASTLRKFASNDGAPTLAGIQGRNTVADATAAGNARSTLADTVARNLIRSGGNPAIATRALDAVNTQGANNLRTVIARNAASAPGDYLNQDQAYNADQLNKYTPLTGVASNISDTAVQPTSAEAPLDASLNQASTYGSATYGRGGPATNAANGGILGVNSSPINYGGIATAGSNILQALIKQYGQKAYQPPAPQDQTGGL